MKKLVVRLPPPHAKQKLIEACTKKRIVVPTGRRFGKTTLVARKSVQLASAGRKVLYCAPVTSQTDAYWDMCTEWLADAIAINTVNRNLAKRNLTFPSGGVIAARTAFKPDHLRGDYADYLILDEYAYQNPEIWEKVGAPMLLDNDGDAVFISSPDKRNHFYLLYLKALADTERWAVFNASSLENPFLSESALEDMMQDMDDIDYRQEILGEFVEGEGSVFSLKPEDFIPAGTETHEGHRLVAGLDWGRQKDYTCLSIGCATCGIELFLDRFTKVDYPTQRDKIKGYLDSFSPDIEILAEANAMGLPNIEQMRQDGIAVQAFDTTNASKAQIVQALRLALNQSSWKWLDIDYARLELEAYEMRVTPAGNVTYNAPTGLNDDSVVARMLMLRQATTGTFTLG